MVPITQLQAYENNPVDEFKNIHIMILHSSPKAAGLIKDVVSHLGFSNISIAHDGYQGVHMLRKQNVDIVFVDPKLKVYRSRDDADTAVDLEANILPISGIDFVKRLRRSPQSPSPFIPIVMLLENANDAGVGDARDAGVDEIVINPINAEQFSARLVSIIKSPRVFITAETYKGPCRRRQSDPLSVPASGREERRHREIRLVRRPSADKATGDI